MTFLITGVTLGDVSKTGGDSAVSNAADLALAASWDSAAIPAPVVSSGVSGAFVSLDLSEPYESPAGSAVSLTISGAPLVYAGAVDSARLGIPTAGNAAQAAYPVGWESFAYGFTTRATFDLSSRELPLSLEGAYTSPTALNVGLYLDGKPLVSAASVGDQTEFGSASVEAPLSVRPFGFDASDHSIPRAHRGETGSWVELRLDVHYQSVPGSSVSLPLSGAPLLLASAGLQQLFGLPSVGNASQAFYPFGFDSNVFGYRTRAFRSDLDSGNLSLILEGNYESPNAAAIQLLWASETKTLSPFGFASFHPGEPIVRVAQLFLEGIQPPADAVPAPSLKNLNRAVSPLGSDFLELGVHLSVINSGVAVRPAGIAPPGLGVHRVGNWHQRPNIQGWTSSAYGRPTVINAAHGVFVGGIAHPPQSGPDTKRQLPSPFVADRIRYTKPSGIPAPSAAISTKHILTYEVQFLDLAARGIPPGPFGVPKHELGNRTVYPTTSLFTVFGRPNLARIQAIEPLGWSSADVAFGLRLDINLQRLLHHSGAADPAGYGETTLRNQFENVDPRSWLSDEFNFPVVFNFDQHLLVQPYAGTNSDPTQWPNYSPFVENKKRYLGPGGFMSSRFSAIGNWIWNKAAPISPEGVYGTEWGADTSVTFRIRKLGQEGWDSFYSTQYTVIHNDAEVLAPSGWSTVQYGRPDPVINLNRTVKHIFPYGGETMGTAFIAGGVRTLSPRLFYDVPSGFPEVRFNPYPIAPNGMAPPQTGAAEVVERFNTFSPKSANVHPVPLVGEPAVLNRNVELRVSPSDQSLYGIPNVANYIYELTVGGDAMLTVPAPLISYRDKLVHATTISVPVFVTIHRIYNLLPDPPARQLVEPRGVWIGSEVSPGVVPAPRIRLATIYPEGFLQQGYGQPVLTRNTIEPAPGIFNPGKFGVPLLAATQYAYPTSAPESLRWGKPRLTPHTIYAPYGDEATDQARRNNPSSGSAQRIDQSIDKTSRHTVTNQHRQIGPVPRHSSSASVLGPSSRLGVPGLVLRRRYVGAYPIRSLRMGFPMFLNVPQYVDLDLRHAGVRPLNAFGQHDVAPPPVPVIPEARPQGLLAIGWGRTRVELFHRELPMQGIPHRGNPQQSLTNPWGVPLVGYPREYVWTAGVLSLWGTAWVSHKNRELPTEGWDSLSLLDEDIGSFRDRMRVTRTNPEGVVVGIPSTAVFGTPGLAFVDRAILARGIASYNSGEHHVKTFISVTVDGWDSLEIGDIDRWEAGLIKTHGDDLNLVGYPRILNPLPISGIFAETVGAVRVGSGIAPLGMPAIGFAGPSISNPFGCTNRVVTPLPVLSQQNVPKPMVSQ